MARVATILLVLFAVAAPLSNGIGNVATGAFLLAAALVVLLVRRERRLPPRTVTLLLLGYLAWNALATLLASPLPVRWNKFVEELWHKPMLIAVPIVAWAVPRSVLRAVKLMVVVGAAVSLYAIFQHFTGRDLVRHVMLPAEGDRHLAMGFFTHHLTYGGQVMLLLVMAGSWLLLGGRRSRAGIGALLVCVGLLGLGLLWSYARSAQLGVLCGALFLIANLRHGSRRWALLAMAVAIGASLAIPSVQRRAVKILIPGSEETRLNLWHSSVRGIEARPWTGWGRGNFGELMSRHRVDGFYDTQAHSHNDFLMQAVDSGVPGLVLYVALLSAIGVNLWRRRDARPEARWLVLGVIAVMIAISVAGLFQVYQTDDEVEMVFYFLLGCGLAITAAAPRDRAATAVGDEVTARVT